MMPITSIMGEILLIGLRSPSGSVDPMELRTLADWVVRPRLLGIGGVAQVTVMGGVMKQYQVLTSPDRLARHGVTLDELTRAIERSNRASGGGFLQAGDRESLIRILGRAADLDDLANTVVRTGDPVPVHVRQVADVRLGGPVKRGEGSVNGRPAVILSVQKQPSADTVQLTERIDRTLAEIRAATLAGVGFDTEIFRQERFIDAAIVNVVEAIRDGTVWVVVVLFVFLWNLRVSLITLTAVPLSVIVTALVFDHFGITVNTMTLGGLAVAIGELVDHSIIDVENNYRRLKENHLKNEPESSLEVIYGASMEVRHSNVYAAVIVGLVVLPLFSLPGLEGRMFAPLGLSYLLAPLASLEVSLTVTPALASYVLPGARLPERPGDPWLLRNLKRLDTHLRNFTLRYATALLVAVAMLVAASIGTLAWMGREFLPAFNEGTLTVAATCPPGTILAETDRIGWRVQTPLGAIPEVTHVARRTGRAELDEHAENVNFSKIDVTLAEPEPPLAGPHFAVLRAIPGLRHLEVRRIGRDRKVVLAEIHDALLEMLGVVFNIGQPISARLDHIMSGINALIAVKLFGPDLTVLWDKADVIALLMAKVPGVVDFQVEPQVDIPQVQVRARREATTAYGLAPAAFAETLETAFQRRAVSQVLEGQRTFDLVVWFVEAARHDVQAIRSTLLSTPTGGRGALGDVAEVIQTDGPNTINRENVVRRIVVQANTAGRDLVGVVTSVRRAVGSSVLPTLPPGYFLEYGGQFDAQRQANRRLLFLGCVAMVGVTLLLYKALESWRAALQVLVNVPLAAIGSVVALLLAHWPGVDAFRGAPLWTWPRVWAGSVTLSVAHWVGFVRLIGVVSRNGIMMISHYLHLMR